jgi:hypothetical protein
MLAWFGELNVKERRTMGACFGGWALDAFDVQMYSFVIPTVIALWGGRVVKRASLAQSPC